MQCSCTVQLCSAAVQYSCAVQLCSAAVQCSCTVQLCSAAVQCSCAVQLYSAAVQYSCACSSQQLSGSFPLQQVKRERDVLSMQIPGTPTAGGGKRINLVHQFSLLPWLFIPSPPFFIHAAFAMFASHSHHAHHPPQDTPDGVPPSPSLDHPDLGGGGLGWAEAYTPELREKMVRLEKENEILKCRLEREDDVESPIAGAGMCVSPSSLAHTLSTTSPLPLHTLTPSPPLSHCTHSTTSPLPLHILTPSPPLSHCTYSHCHLPSPTAHTHTITSPLPLHIHRHLPSHTAHILHHLPSPTAHTHTVTSPLLLHTLTLSPPLSHCTHSHNHLPSSQLVTMMG